MKALVFPGQGSQYVGMGKDLYESFPECKNIFKKTDSILGYSLSEIMFLGDELTLLQTSNTQPAIFLHSYLVFCLSKPSNINAMAGHSLGEYTALCCAGVISFEDALRAVSARGRIMQEASDATHGGMAAIIGLKESEVEAMVYSASSEGIIQIANYNAPSQIVVSGEMKAIEKFISLGKEYGARMVKKLNVSGAFHSPLMQPAQEKLEEVLKDISLNDAKLPVCLNTIAKHEIKGTVIRKNLILQLTSPVLWTQSIEHLTSELGINNFLELGPKKVLQGLIKRTATNIEVASLDTKEDIDVFIKEN